LFTLRWPQKNNQGRRMAASSLFIGSVEGCVATQRRVAAFGS
jgi:hypothetical protein